MKLHRPLPLLALAGLALLAALLAGPLAPGCLVEQYCFSQADCPADQSCDTFVGVCSKALTCQQASDCPAGYAHCREHVCAVDECETDAHCPTAFVCRAGSCKPAGQGPLDCPADMVSVEDAFCIDRYEASRPDATAASAGSDDSQASSRPGVLPWLLGSGQNGLAQAACQAAGKDLCTEQEWFAACRGPDQTVYAYGDEYAPDACNGIDTFCACESGPCAGHDPCPYPGCFHDCRADTAFRLQPTGSFPDCTNAYGVFDMNGNVWEHVRDGDDTRIRGGAYNCSDSQQFHRCDYIPGNWAPAAKGFRCCAHPEASE